jgi:hypothetical protein
MIPSYQKLRPILDSAITTSKRKSSRSLARIAEKYCSNQLELLMILQEKPRTLKGAIGTEIDSAAGLALSSVVWRTPWDGPCTKNSEIWPRLPIVSSESGLNLCQCTYVHVSSPRDLQTRLPHRLSSIDSSDSHASHAAFA